MASPTDDGSHSLSAKSPASCAPTPTSSGLSSGLTSGFTSGFKSGCTAPPGQPLRRAKTVDEPPRRTWAASNPSDAPTPERLVRRSSSLSDYSIEARNILNPATQAHVEPQSPESSPLASLSLAFALLPAIAGSLFQNGHGFVTDIMLLGLAGVFLHWSVTQPWLWYHAAQQVRVQHEADADSAVEDDSDAKPPVPGAGATRPGLENVPEEDEAGSDEAEKGRAVPRQTTAQQQAALRELHVYEVAALVACLVLPLVSAGLLHAIRAQLSRPSEGLVSNYNLTIFLLVSELRVFSHMLRLVQSRTLHLQRVVHRHSPFASSPADDLVRRLDRLEALISSPDAPHGATASWPAASSGLDLPAGLVNAKQEAAISRHVRNALSPDLEALNRAVRRYEKKTTLLQLQTEARFATLDARIDDAIALAAAAAKNSLPVRSRLLRAVDSLTATALLPFRAAAALIFLPLRWSFALARRAQHKQLSSAARPPARSSRSGKAPLQQRPGSDRAPARTAKR
ncbi:hypothetical protein CDD82_566 [Ophiocordyceps australis]|uniref:Uncharacterized protein n=1 Tax=Ophiocordyceps australis TaxID=1399860 RepID=A0A2C5YN32_9HYPO|nr:hypothetical protein CDD82_566 [Ophiocordyceps australis]